VLGDGTVVGLFVFQAALSSSVTTCQTAKRSAIEQ